MRFKYILLFITILTFNQARAQNIADMQEIDASIADLIIKSPLGFRDMRGKERQRTPETVLYDAQAMPGLHAQQFFITDVPLTTGVTQSYYMGYYTDVNDIALVTGALLAMPGYGGGTWTVNAGTSQKEGETIEEVRLGGVKVGQLAIQTKEKTAVLTLGFYETPAHAKEEAEKKKPHITAKCESGSCTAGKGELTVYSAEGILTDRLSGEFGGGTFNKGIHYIYGKGLGPSSVEKDEGIFSKFILTEGTVTLSGYGLADSVFSTKAYTAAGNCISGDCVNGEGKWQSMLMTFGGAQITVKEGKFKDGAFLTGSMHLEGVDTLYDGAYTMKNYKYHPRHNQAWADAVFLPKGSSEEIKGTWGGGSNYATAVPFYLSDDYFHFSHGFIGPMKTKGIPQWILDVYVPISHRRGEIAQQEAYKREYEALQYDMKIHPLDYQNSNNSSPGSNSCSCCNGTGSRGSGKFFMGRETPQRCSCCGGTGRVY